MIGGGLYISFNADGYQGLFHVNARTPAFSIPSISASGSMGGRRSVICRRALPSIPTALKLDDGASHASCSDANPLSSRRIRTVPIDGIQEKATQYFKSSIDSLYNDVQYGGIVPCTGMTRIVRTWKTG